MGNVGGRWSGGMEEGVPGSVKAGTRLDKSSEERSFPDPAPLVPRHTAAVPGHLLEALTYIPGLSQHLCQGSLVGLVIVPPPNGLGL